MSSRVPRKQRNLKNAAKKLEDASVVIADSNCSDAVTLEAANLYEFFGFGKAGQTYQQSASVDYMTIEDQQLQTNGRTADGAVFNLKNASNIIGDTANTSLPSLAKVHYFTTANQGVTGSSLVNFCYSQNGPQAPYIPQLVHGSQGLAASQKWVYFVPCEVTGANGINMPATLNKTIAVTIAGAVAPGESVQVYTISGSHNSPAGGATGSAFTFSASFCSTPNYSVQTVYLPTGTLGVGPHDGIMVAYTSSYFSDRGSEDTPYAGVVVSVYPSNRTS